MRIRTIIAALLSLILIFGISTAGFAEEEAPLEVTQETDIDTDGNSSEPQQEELPEEIYEEPVQEVSAEESGEAPLLDAADAENTAELNPGESTVIEQDYILQQDGTTVNTTKVKITWAVTNVKVTCSTKRTWDTEALKWVEEKTYTATDGGASFILTNYSSVNVLANVSFAAADSMADKLNGDVIFTNNNCTVQTPVNQKAIEYDESAFTALQQTISATVKVNANAFADLMDDQGKLGTYTLSINTVS